MQCAADISAVGKDHNAINIIIDQNIIQQGKLFTGSSNVDFLIYCIGRHALGANLYSHWIIGPGF